MRTKSEERRQRILDIAYEAYRELGFEAATMALIASRVGGSKATLYSYFPTKEDLFVEVMLTVAQRLKRDAFCTFEQDIPFAEKLRAFGANYLHFVLSPEMLAMRRIAIGQSSRSDIGIKLYERGMKTGWTKIATQMQSAMANGQLQNTDPWMTAMYLKGILEAGMSEPALLGVAQDISMERLEIVAKAAVEIFLRAFGLTDK